METTEQFLARREAEDLHAMQSAEEIIIAVMLDEFCQPEYYWDAEHFANGEACQGDSCKPECEIEQQRLERFCEKLCDEIRKDFPNAQVNLVTDFSDYITIHTRISFREDVTSDASYHCYHTLGEIYEELLRTA